jgi:hypothetical protein
MGWFIDPVRNTNGKTMIYIIANANIKKEAI